MTDQTPETAWVSPAVTRRAEIAERKALAALLGEAWLAHDLANDAFLAEEVPRPTVEEYAGFVADIAARLTERGVRVASEDAAPLPGHQTPGEYHDYRVACVKCGEPGFLHVSWRPEKAPETDALATPEPEARR